VRIAVPRDRAYCFYYPENLEALAAAGAEVRSFRPADGEPFPDCDGAYLGGGYPEVHAAAVAANRDFLDGLRALSEGGGAVYGECGGLMTMCASIRAYGDEHRMAGIFSTAAELTAQRQGLSYVRATATADNFLFPGQAVRGHEFHYSRLTPTPAGRYGFRVERGNGIGEGRDGLTVRRSMGTYLHLHALSCPGWAPALVTAARGH
jgi:cobyrinic acid a,c-diamide synthase